MPKVAVRLLYGHTIDRCVAHLCAREDAVDVLREQLMVLCLLCALVLLRLHRRTVSVSAASTLFYRSAAQA